MGGFEAGYAAKVVDLEPGRKMSVDWGPTGVSTWELAESDGKTRLTFVQSGFDEQHPPYGAWTGSVAGLAELRRFHERGELAADLGPSPRHRTGRRRGLRAPSGRRLVTVLPTGRRPVRPRSARRRGPPQVRQRPRRPPSRAPAEKAATPRGAAGVSAVAARPPPPPPAEAPREPLGFPVPLVAPRAGLPVPLRDRLRAGRVAAARSAAGGGAVNRRSPGASSVSSA